MRTLKNKILKPLETHNIMSFQDTGLSAELLQVVEKQGYTTATPIQKKVIPAIIAGRDVIASAPTGTGKTAAFTMPLLHNLAQKPHDRKRRVRALIVTPTRELAAQVHESVKTYGANLPFRTTVIFGGVKFNPQISRLRQGCDIVIATPGRLLDLENQGAINLSQVEILVLDEADRMLDMGFTPDIKRILSLIPKKRQSLLFSATYNAGIKKLASALLDNPLSVEVAAQNQTAEKVEQLIYPVDRDKKRALLSYMIGDQNWKQVLVFTRTKHGADRLTEQLENDGLTATSIHGNKSQGARTRALTKFKTGKVRVLVATDVAARGLDIKELPYVVNFDLPMVPEDYVHRIGRTGRASSEGLAVSLVAGEEMNLLRNIEKLLKQTLKQEVIPGYEPTPRSHAKSNRAGGGSHATKKRAAQRQRVKGRENASPRNNKAKGNAPAKNASRRKKRSSHA